MSTATVSVSPHRTPGPIHTPTFAGNLKSEWIKLTTIRSTIWSLTILTITTLGLSALSAFASGAAFVEGFLRPKDFAGTRHAVIDMAIGFNSLTCLVVAVLGALFSAGEYTTGSIRATMTTTPRRLPVLWAKALVLGLTTFIYGFILLLGSVMMAAAIYAGHSNEFVSVVDPVVVAAIAGAAGFLAFTAIFALAIGFIVRSVAGAISTVVGILFVVPIVTGILEGSLKWLKDIVVYQFPTSGHMMGAIPTDGQPLLPWQATLVVLAWVVVATGFAVVVLKRKDV